MKNSCNVVIGGNSEIAAECAKLWAESGKIKNLVLVGRNLEKLNFVKSKIEEKNQSILINVEILDFSSIDHILNMVQKITKTFLVEKILFALGTLESENLKEERDLLYINGIAPILLSQAFIPYLVKGKSHLIFISSIAAERGRKTNYLYGAGKSMLTTYVEGLQHKTSENQIFITLIKLGPTKTNMLLETKKYIPFSASLEYVAKLIVDASRLRKKVVFIPLRWKFIMFFIKRIPNFIFKKFNI